MDSRAWRATVHGVTKSQTRLSDQQTHTHTHTHEMFWICFLIFQNSFFFMMKTMLAKTKEMEVYTMESKSLQWSHPQGTPVSGVVGTWYLTLSSSALTSFYLGSCPNSTTSNLCDSEQVTQLLWVFISSSEELRLSILLISLNCL